MPADPPWLLLLLYLASGSLLLAKGADWLVDGSARMARRMGVSTLAIGLTVVAWGTSAPEVVVTGMAAYEGHPAIGIGNVLGSNIANIGLVLGACALVLPRVLEARIASRDLFWLFASVGAFWWVCLDGGFSRGNALLLLGLFGIYNLWLWRDARREGRAAAEAAAALGVPDPRAASHGGKPPWRMTLLGLVGVALGAKLIVMGAEGGALRLGVDQRVVGLTVVAIGTSLPELAAGLGGAFKGESDISLGNVLGSNVFNVLAVFGLVALVQPLQPGTMPTPEAEIELAAAFEGALGHDLPHVLAFSAAAALLPFLGGARFGRLKGAALLTAYAAYCWSLF